MKNIILWIVIIYSFNAIAILASDINNLEANNTESLDAFTMMPMIRSVAVSADGKKLAIVRATTKHGDYIIEIRNAHNLNERPITLGAARMKVSNIMWLNNEKLGVGFRQILKDGSRKYWVNEFAIVNADGEGNWLLPSKSKKLRGFSILNTLPGSNNEILAQTDVNNNYIPDVVKYNFDTGRSVTVMRGNTKLSGGFISDHDGDIRAATGWNSVDNSIDLYAREKGEDNWKLVKQNFPEKRENFSFLGFSKEDPNKIYVNTNLGQDKTGIYLYDIKTGKYSERLFGLKGVDVDNIITSNKGDLLGFSYTGKHLKKYLIDENEKALDLSLKNLFKNKLISIVSRSDNDDVLIIRTSSSNDAGTYYLITNKNKIDKIGKRLPLLKEEELADVKYVSYKARDGRKIRAYITIPNGEAPFPAVVLPHGGPWSRDSAVFDEWSQLLAYNGYIVIQPNYRGSTGYGLEHWIAGDNNWGLKMQDDLDDAAMYLVNKGLAEKDKLAMFGWSYGGYAAFVASMRENNIYQCTIAGAGVSDLSQISADLNENRFLNKLQRPTITGISPLSQVEKVNIPILVIHGNIDGRVPVSHSREFVDQLKKYQKDYKYVELDEADHFSDTLFYNHKTEFYSALLSWLDNKCKLKSSN